MVVHTIEHSHYTRIKGRRKHSVLWNQARIDFGPHFTLNLERNRYSNLVQFHHLQRRSKMADAFFPIGDELFICEFKNAQINSTLDKYYSLGLTSTMPKSPKVKSSLTSLMKSRIQQLERLPNAWDSYSARPIDTRAIAAAKSLLIRISSDLAPELISDVFIAPCSDGGIQLEWELNSKELIIKITPDGQQQFFLFVSSSGIEEEGAITSEAKLRNLLQGILSS